MRRVLLIHYHFLPVHNVAVKRLMGYAAQLPAFGWAPMVLTSDWRSLDQADPSWGLSWEPELARSAAYPIYRVAHPRIAQPSRDRPESRFKLIRKARRLRRMFFGDYPDEFIAWAEAATAEGLRIARREAVDAILSYCPPETNHVVAARLARRLGVPWVAFFGDLYGFLDPPLPRYSLEGLWRRTWHRRCLAPAAACVGVSPAMVSHLRSTYRKPVELVLTGFDPAEFVIVDGLTVPPRDRLVLSHVGSLYPDDQRPEIFLEGLDRLLERYPEIEPRLEVSFVGSKCDERLRAMLRGRPAERVCRVRPKVDPRSAVALVRESDALLAFTCTRFRECYGTLSYPTKVFEAMGARRPVLAVPADGDWVDDLLARSGGGASARDAEEVMSRLWEWFSAWSRHGSVPYHGRPEVIAEFSLERQTACLARLLDSLS